MGDTLTTELIYLACPYTHKEHYMMVARWLLVNRVAAKLMAEGKYVFSPISHTHPIAEASKGKLPRGWEYWEGYDKLMISCCTKILVLQLPGWETSTGVQAEIKIGLATNTPVEYMSYDLTPSYEETIKEAELEESEVRTVVSTYDHQGICLGSI